MIIIPLVLSHSELMPELMASSPGSSPQDWWSGGSSGLGRHDYQRSGLLRFPCGDLMLHSLAGES